MAEKVNMRECVLEVLLHAEREEGYLDDLLHAQLKKYQYLNKQERAFLSRLCEGVNEYRLRLDYIVNQFSKTPIHKCKPFIRCVLRMGVYQILFMDAVPNSAACNESVKLTKKHGFSRLSGFVNGVLRAVARGVDKITYPDEIKEPLKYASIYYSVPIWLLEQWASQYDVPTALCMAKASTKKPELTVRFQVPNHEIDDAIEQMEKESIKVSPVAWNETMNTLFPSWMSDLFKRCAKKISNVDYLSRYESFKKGYYAIQDVSSMLPGMMGIHQLEEWQQKGRDMSDVKVLDMCAAPGGKTTHIASFMKNSKEISGTVIARDRTEEKANRILENRERLHLDNVLIEVQDALEFTDELKEQMDLVILDAPCSGLGVLARKKEIAYHMSKEQEEDLASLQKQMLAVAAQYVKQDGILLYSTCTVNRQENDENVDWFLNKYGNFECVNQIQLLPGIVPTDGFYVAQLRKTEE